MGKKILVPSVAVNNNSPIHDYALTDDQTQPTFEMTPEFKPFTENNLERGFVRHWLNSV